MGENMGKHAKARCDELVAYVGNASVTVAMLGTSQVDAVAATDGLLYWDLEVLSACFFRRRSAS